MLAIPSEFSSVRYANGCSCLALNLRSAEPFDGCRCSHHLVGSIVSFDRGPLELIHTGAVELAGADGLP